MRKLQAHSIDSEDIDNEVPIYSTVMGSYGYSNGTKVSCNSFSPDKFFKDISLKGIYTDEEDLV
jgi:hypothetical protein